jgi:outer membrane protein assembly factor BamB
MGISRPKIKDPEKEASVGLEPQGSTFQRKFGVAGIVAVVVAFLFFLAYLVFMATISKPMAKKFLPPVKTSWKPSGIRMAGNLDHSVIPKPKTHKTMHGNINNTDNLWIAAAPMFELDWIAEENMYAGDGPTLDRHGNAYFSPIHPKEDVSLISLDGKTGKRRWIIPGEGDQLNYGSGATLILNSPDSSGEEIIYHVTYAHAMAITTAGEILWKTATGLTDPMHMWSMSYHPQTDSVIGLSDDGHVFAMDRKTGVSRKVLMELPGAPTAPSDERAPAFIMNMGDKETEKVFGKLADGRGFFSTLVDAIFGGGFKVANNFGIDPNTGKIYIAATAPDSEDGKEDGMSEYGALYALNLVETNGTYSLIIENHYYFAGGSASTPTISPDSGRVMVADNDYNIIALDAELNELWRLNMGEQIASSIAVSADNRELYASGRKNIFKIIDRGTYGELVWTANLDAWSTDVEFNALNPTVTANGVVVSIGAGYLQEQQLMLSVGMALLDRETGYVRYFAEGREESIAISVVGPKGEILTANSPVRRVMGRVFLPKLTPPLIGGISRYRPIRQDLLVRDASCAAKDRLVNMQPWYLDHPAAASDDFGQVAALIEQAQNALETAMTDVDFNKADGKTLGIALNSASQSLAHKNIIDSIQHLDSICAFFE